MLGCRGVRRFILRRSELAFLSCLACARAEGAPHPPAPDGSGPAPACDAAGCNALAGPCQLGSCDEQTGACRLSAVREGEPCLEGNACGPALCRSGECSALAPFTCAAVAECQMAVCRPERGGCVSEPLRPPGASCQTPVLLQGAGTSTATADTRCSEGLRTALKCGSPARGPSAYFALDLRAASGPTPVVFVIDAEFSFEAALARGPCGDSIVQACAAEAQSDHRSRSLSLTLPPDYYQLVVSATSEDDGGEVSVATAIGAASCSAPAVNDECAAALALDPSLSTQSVIGNAACGTASLSGRCGFDALGDVFYDLDLSRRTHETLLEVDVANVDESGPTPDLAAALLAAESSGCGEPILCGARFAKRIPPGRYRIGVAQARDVASSFGSTPVTELDPPAPFALRVRLRDADCSTTSNDTWQTAIDLDPSAASQLLAGNTACGEDDFASACTGDLGAPELFYRLDLRGQQAPRELYLAGRADSDLVVYVLEPDPSGAPSRVAGCKTLAPLTENYSLLQTGSAFLTLAPRLYYLVIDGRVRNSGRFELELQDSELDYSIPLNCFNDYSLSCLEDSEPACADSRASPECLQAALECGLDVAVYEAFCAGFPGCCEGTADPDECLAAWRANLECN